MNRTLPLLVALACASGCCARYVNRRPELVGFTQDIEGRPLRGIHLEACTETDQDTAGYLGARRAGSCLRRAITLSDRSGQFEIERARELDFSCGKEQHALTVVIACARDGRVGHTLFKGAWPGGERRHGPLRLVMDRSAGKRPQLHELARRVCSEATYAGRRRLPEEMGSR